MIVEDLLDHVFIFGVLAFALAAFGLALMTPHRWLRLVIWVVAGTVAALWTALGLLWSTSFGHTPVVARVPAPGRPYEAVIRESSACLIDPAWSVWIEQTGSLVARQWEVGLISGDDSDYDFRNATWKADGQLTVRLRRHSLNVHVDPDTGKPLPTSWPSPGC